jgi:hypothetical protein
MRHRPAACKICNHQETQNSRIGAGGEKVLGQDQLLTMELEIALNDELKESAGRPDGEGVPW